MKMLFSLLLLVSPALAQANILTCQVPADGVNIPQNSYVELDPSGPFFILYRDYSRKNGPAYFVKSELVSNAYLSSWRVERSESNCTVQTSRTEVLRVEYRCEKVNAFLDLQGFLKYDSSTASGHYAQRGFSTDGRDMKFEFDFSACH